MKRTLQVMGILALALLCGVLYQAEEALRYSRSEILPKVLLTIEKANHAMLEIELTAKNAREATDEGKKASIEQRKYWAQAAQQTNKDLADLDAVLHSAGDAVRSLNSAIVHADNNLSSVSIQTTTSIKQIGDTLASLQPVILKASESMDNLARLTGDPALLQTVQHVNASTANVESATGHLDASTKEVELYVKHLTKPASWVRSLGIFLLDTASKFALIFK